VKPLGVYRKGPDYRKSWHKFSKNYLSVVGLGVVALVGVVAIFAPYISPFPAHAGFFVDYPDAHEAPSWLHIFGTDQFGRDVLTRIMFAFRYSLMMAVVVLALVVPAGVVLGLVAGYYRGGKLDMVIMRAADIFLAVPPLVLALSICSVLTPSVFNAMMAVSLMWWPWYTRLVYSISSSLRNEPFVQASEIAGASPFHIIFREILPNCLGPILTKMSLDAGWVILIGASLSFVGLGAQPPTPDLGTMVSDGASFLPEQWWIAIFPALTIVLIILGFNLLGDGVRDMFGAETV
jgi:peptide/nickel transport system permease protein